jgi:hypothetical protein
MIFGIPVLIKYASRLAELLPGDLLLTGSPAGNGPTGPYSSSLGHRGSRNHRPGDAVQPGDLKPARRMRASAPLTAHGQMLAKRSLPPGKSAAACAGADPGGEPFAASRRCQAHEHRMADLPIRVQRVDGYTGFETAYPTAGQDAGELLAIGSAVRSKGPRDQSFSGGPTRSRDRGSISRAQGLQRPVWSGQRGGYPPVVVRRRLESGTRGRRRCPPRAPGRRRHRTGPTGRPARRRPHDGTAAADRPGRRSRLPSSSGTPRPATGLCPVPVSSHSR